MTLLPFILPVGFEPLVEEDEKVKEGQPIAQNQSATDTFIDIAKELEIPIRKVRNLVKKNPGDSVVEGDILAEKKGIMGGRKVLSTLSGTVIKIDEENGGIIVRGKGEETAGKIVSPVDGVVTMCNNEKILIKTDREALSVTRGMGTNFLGEYILLKGEKVDPGQIDSQVDDKIVIGNLFDKESVAKALGVGAKGIIAGGISDEEFQNLADKKTETPIVIVDWDALVKFLKTAKKIMIDVDRKIIVRL